jgi:hypothetical protein
MFYVNLIQDKIDGIAQTAINLFLLKIHLTS